MENTPVLTLDQLCFEKICYSRKEVNLPAQLSYEMNFRKDIAASDDEIHYKVTLTSSIKSSNEEIELSVSLAGFFTCQCDNPSIKKGLINDNTIAILFPYLRSQISLITTQPDLPPIVLPTVNVVELFKKQVEDNA